MITLQKPNDLNGTQLCEELEAVGITINKETSPFIDGNGNFWLDIDAKDATKAQEILDFHIPKLKSEPTVSEKLASVGLSLDDLKAALGLENN